MLNAIQKKRSDIPKKDIELAEARKKKGLTQQELAELIGSSQGQVTRLETGTYTGYTSRPFKRSPMRSVAASLSN